MITQYHRPLTLDDAVVLAARPRAVVVAGGTSVVPTLASGSWEVVDLQALDLGGVSHGEAAVACGAMASLQDIADASYVPQVIADAAMLEGPNTLRAAATIGGVVGDADPESPLLTALMAFGASVDLSTQEGAGSVPIADLVAAGSSPDGAIITAVHIPTEAESASAWTGRTPKDRPIVMAVAVRRDSSVRLALSGVSDRPVVVAPDALDDLEPPSDFRGSSTYRLHLASVLSQRALAAIGGPA